MNILFDWLSVVVCRGGVAAVDTKPFLWNNYEKYHSPTTVGGEVCAPTPHQPSWNYAHHPQETNTHVSHAKNPGNVK